MNVNLAEAERRLGVSFRDKALLQMAFTHRSFLNEARRPGLQHNERLEFLGDAVIEIVVTEYLYKTRDGSEGELTAIRAALVCADMLTRIAQEFGFDDFLLLSRGEAQDKGRGRILILASTFEAFVGALYLDQGHEAATEFLKRILLSRLNEVIEKKLYRDAKNDFQDITQETSGSTPTYQVLRAWGPDHDKTFTVGVFLDNRLVGKGTGKSKREAETTAAKIALEREFPERVK